MKTRIDANGMSRNGTTEPYAVTGAGPITAFIRKSGDEQSGWQYRFNIFRMYQTSGRVSQWFHPSDLEHIAKLVKVVAQELAQDGCLKNELRDDLYCLAACLDDVFPGVGHPPPPRGDIADAVSCVLDYLWDDVADCQIDLTEEHIRSQLVVLKQWLEGDGREKNPKDAVLRPDSN